MLHNKIKNVQMNTTKTVNTFKQHVIVWHMKSKYN